MTEHGLLMVYKQSMRVQHPSSPPPYTNHRHLVCSCFVRAKLAGGMCARWQMACQGARSHGHAMWPCAPSSANGMVHTASRSQVLIHVSHTAVRVCARGPRTYWDAKRWGRCQLVTGVISCQARFNVTA
jgi:hypothetical protein